MVESALRLDIDTLVRIGVIRPGAHLGGEMKFLLDADELAIQFESSATHPADNWLRLQYTIRDYWTDERHEIDDKIYLTASRPHFGGRQWWFATGTRRVRQLYLPLGGRRFLSRHAYRLAYASAGEAAHDRAMRRVRKLHRRIGGDWMVDTRPPRKPRRTRWATYDRLLGKLVAAEGVVDERFTSRVCGGGCLVPAVVSGGAAPQNAPPRGREALAPSPPQRVRARKVVHSQDDAAASKPRTGKATAMEFLQAALAGDPAERVNDFETARC
jgi:hypothetical protein